MLKAGDVVILPFPFTDLSAQKVRPAVVISNQGYNSQHKNVLVVGVYGAEKACSVSIGNQDTQQQKFLKPSFVSFQNVFVVEKSLILKSVDQLKSVKLKSIQTQFKSYF